jgi:hypothetical protein
MGDEFEEFLQKKAQKFHAETWEHFHKGSDDPDWKHAKDKEILIGEILSEYYYYSDCC